MMSLFPMAVLTIFLERRVGFDVTDIMLLQGAFGLAMALFEFPSGYLADRIGYRRCLILACALWMVAWPVYGFSEGWAGVVAAELLLGVGMSLVSGCDSALMYETLLASGQEADFTRWAGRQTFAGQTAEGTAALAAGLLFALGPQWPFLAQGLSAAVGLLLAWRLVDPDRVRPDFTDAWGQVRGMVVHVFHDRRLLILFVAAVVLSLASFVPVWTIQLYAVDAGMSELWLGPFWALANFSVAVAALLSHRLSSRLTISGVVLGGTGLIVVGFLGLGLAHALWGVFFYYCLTIMRGLQSPTVHHYEQRLIPSGERAGFVSMRSMVFRLAFLVVGPLVGWGVDRMGQHPVMLILALFFGVVGVATYVAVDRAFAGAAGRA